MFFVNEKDMAAVAMRAVEDPRTLNKILHLRPQENLCSLDKLVSLWENKIGKTLKKTYIQEEELVKKVQGIHRHIYSIVYATKEEFNSRMYTSLLYYS